MNIFKEITQSYTYNGVVSLKALEDDIVTLENQIDSYNATLHEIQMRGKKSLPLVEKIRDAKIRLSLLKVVYRRESDKTTPDDVIINMLGLSAKDAKEIESPGTAADKKEPIPQNFEKSEIEIVDDNEESDVVEGEKITDEDTVVESAEYEIDETKNDVTIETETDKDVSASIKNEETNEISTEAIEEPIKKDDEYPTINHNEDKPAEHKFVKPEMVVDDESGVITITKTPESQTEYFIPKNEKNKEEDKNTVEMEKFKVSDDVYDLTKATDEELAEFCTTLKSDDEIKVMDVEKVITGENETPVNDCPPPTIDDYLEPIGEKETIMNTVSNMGNESGIIMEEKMDESDKDGIYTQETYDENGEPGTVKLDNDMGVDLDIYSPFYKENNEFYATFDLSDYTNMVNTNSVIGYYNNMKKTLEIVFTDIMDYSIFVKLSKELEENPRFFRRLLKKRKSIFMYVHEKIGYKTKTYCYEFTRCRLKETDDTEYLSKNTSNENITHTCKAVFKYKRMKFR